MITNKIIKKYRKGNKNIRYSSEDIAVLIGGIT